MLHCSFCLLRYFSLFSWTMSLPKQPKLKCLLIANTMMLPRSLLFLFAILAALCLEAEAFLGVRQALPGRGNILQSTKPAFLQNAHHIATNHKNNNNIRLNRTRVFSNAKVDGTGRGLYLLGIAFFISVWIFSIPPEYRRAHFCPTKACEGESDRGGGQWMKILSFSIL